MQVKNDDFRVIRDAILAVRKWDEETDLLPLTEHFAVANAIKAINSIEESHASLKEYNRKRMEKKREDNPDYGKSQEQIEAHSRPWGGARKKKTE